MMLEWSVGFTATHGSSSVFTKFVSPGSKTPEMSQEAKGLFPFAGGLGVPEAWCTAVATYGPADAAANGRRTIMAKITAAARGMPSLMPHLHRIEPKTPAHPPNTASHCQAGHWSARPAKQPLDERPQGDPVSGVN